MNCIAEGRSHRWRLVWFRAVIEEGKTVNLYQCTECMEIVMDTEEHIDER